MNWVIAGCEEGQKGGMFSFSSRVRGGRIFPLPDRPWEKLVRRTYPAHGSHQVRKPVTQNANKIVLSNS
jgi:hypothetical protein